VTELFDALGCHGLSLSWQLTIHLALAWALAALLGERLAGCRYRLWLLVLGRLLVPVVLVTPIGFLPAPAPGAATGLGETMGMAWPGTAHLDGGPIPPPAPSSVGDPGHAPASIPSTLAFGWLLGVIFLTAASAWRHRRLRREVDQAPAAEGPLAVFVDRKRRALGLAAPVEVRLMPASASGTGPAVVGLLRPVMVVPEHFATHWRDAVHGPLVLHELVHLARRDHWISLAVTVTRIGYFFHPLVWLATSRLLRERERVCDDAVVGHLGASAAPYVRALCHHALALPGRRSATGLGTSLARGRSDLMRRIERMVAPGYRQAGRWAVLGVLLVAALLLAVASGRAGTGGEGRGADPPGSEAGASSITGLYGALERALGKPGGQEVAASLALRLVRDHPAMPAEAASDCVVAVYDSGLEARVRDLWLRHLQDRPDELAVLRNAATFFQWSDGDLAESLLERGRALDPESWWWESRLGALRLRRAGTAPPERSRALLETAHDDLLAALALDPPAAARVPLLGEAAGVALRLGRLDEAESLARRQLDGASALAGTWSYGNVLHASRSTLGEVALRRGDLDRAGDWLLAAADVPSTPQLASFGPRMALAEELLRRGRSEPVLRYLKACAVFWKSDRGRLDRWAAEIRAGRIPDFGGNRR